jgi:hypothetical protein
MPTPRLGVQLSRQGSKSAGASNPSNWIPGIVLDAPTGVGGSYQVSVQGGTLAQASSSIDSPIVVGDLVWVVKSGSQYVITGMQ